MISLQIKDTKTFMSHLLIKDTFDSMLLSQAELNMAYSFTLDGSVNRSFYTDEEYDGLDNRNYTPWKTIKPFCFSFIKGSKVPSGMKIIFVMPDSAVERIIQDSGASLSHDDIEGLFNNIRYKDNIVSVITGTSLKTFTLDKSVEHSFDNYIKLFLEHYQIDYEEN